MCLQTLIKAEKLPIQAEKYKKILPVWTKEQFFEEVQEHGAKLVVYAGRIHNLGGFHHPGGDILDNGVIGTDATLLVDRVHALDKKVQLLLRSRVIATLDDPDALLSNEDKDLRDLSKRVKAEGQQPPFETMKAYIQLLEPFAVALGGILMLVLGFTKIGVLILTCAHLRLFWWLHDGGHHGLFADKNRTEFFLDSLGMIFFGLLTYSEFRDHEIHHGFVNCWDRDWTSLEFFDLYHPTKDGTKKRPSILKGIFQLFCFVFGVNTFWFTCMFRMVQAAVLRNSVLLLGVISIRYYLFWYFGWLSFVPVVLAFGAAGFISCLNHVHMDKFEDPSDPLRPKTFLRQQVESTQSMNSGWLWTWISGALDYHVEHHLFPNVPSYRLPELKEPVKALLTRNDVHYNVVPILTGIQLILNQFLDPLRDTLSFSKKGEATLLQKIQEKFNIYRWGTVLFDVVTGIQLISSWNHLVKRLGGHPFLFLVVACWNLLLFLAIRDGISALAFSEFTPAAKLNYQPGFKDIKNLFLTTAWIAGICYPLYCLGIMTIDRVSYSAVSLGRNYIEFYLMAILMDATAFKYVHCWMHQYTYVFKYVHAEHHSTTKSTTCFSAFQWHVLDFLAEHGCAMLVLLSFKWILGYGFQMSMASYYMHTRAAVLVHSCNRHSLVMANPIIDRFIQLTVMHNLHHAKPNDFFEVLPYYHIFTEYRMADNILYDKLMPVHAEYAYAVSKSNNKVT